MPTVKSLAPASLALMVWALAPAQASAGAYVNIHAQVYQNYDATGIPLAVNRRTEAAGSAATDTTALFTSGPSASTHATATAFANVGHLGVSAAGSAQFMTGHYNSKGEASMPSQGAWATAEAKAGWTDMVTFTDTARTGLPGKAMASLDISGLVGASSAPYASVRSPDGGILQFETEGYGRVQISGNGLDWTTQTWDDDCVAVGWSGWLGCARAKAYDPSGTQNYNRGSIGVVPVELDFVFGREFAIGYSLLTAAGGSGGISYYKMGSAGEGSGFADMSHTLLWGGITDVFDASGARVDSFAVSSASGYDYLRERIVTGEVPEPGTGALALAALSAAAWFRRRRPQPGQSAVRRRPGPTRRGRA